MSAIIFRRRMVWWRAFRQFNGFAFQFVLWRIEGFLWAGPPRPLCCGKCAPRKLAVCLSVVAAGIGFH